MLPRWIHAGIRSRPRSRSESRAHICCAPDDISLRLDERELCRLPWADIAQIAAFKTDHWTVDRICLAFRARAHEREYTCLHENREGWDELTREIDRRFSNAFSKCWNDVAIPPFATRWRTIWGEPAPGDTPPALSWPGAD